MASLTEARVREIIREEIATDRRLRELERIARKPLGWAEFTRSIAWEPPPHQSNTRLV